MSRRPFIEHEKITDDRRARPYSGIPDEYATHCPRYEPVGLDGRNDWFRWSCRTCDNTYISRRRQKRQVHYQCVECGAWHFVYKGFFAPSDKKDGCETVPLRDEEFDGTLCRAKIQYTPLDNGGDWYYGSPEWLQAKIQQEKYETVEPIEKV